MDGDAPTDTRSPTCVASRWPISARRPFFEEPRVQQPSSSTGFTRASGRVFEHRLSFRPGRESERGERCRALSLRGT